MSRLYKNWFIHNTVSHPISELVYWIMIPFGKKRAEVYCNRIHDFTLPSKVENGRG